MLGDVAQQPELVVDLVQMPVPAVDREGRNLTGQRDHRRAHPIGGEQRRRSVQHTRSRHHCDRLRPAGHQRELGRACGDRPRAHAESARRREVGGREEAVREEKYIQYVRGMDAAAAEVREKGAQVAFLLEPTPIDDMARVAFGGGVMPQKSTDFYPKLLTGVAIYKL